MGFVKQKYTITKYSVQLNPKKETPKKPILFKHYQLSTMIHEQMIENLNKQTTKQLWAHNRNIDTMDTIKAQKELQGCNGTTQL